MTEARRRATAAGLQTLPEVLDILAARNADGIAITAPGRPPLSYGRLRLQIDEVAKTLTTLGIGRCSRVALAVPNGPEMAVAFASVASFATCAPLNPAYGFTEFDYYLSDLEPSVLIVQSGTSAPAFAAAQKNSIPVVELTPAVDDPAGIFFLAATSGPPKAGKNSRIHDNALILHTSGTTSRPKMVALTQGQLLASATNIAAGLRMTDRDRCLNVMPLFHIHGLVGVLLSSIVAGATVICTPGFDAEKFFGWLEQYQPTWYSAVPTIHQAILANARAHPTAIQRHRLRWIRSCSASLPAAVALELEKCFGVPVIEAYGMTEAAHQIASNPLPPKERKIGSVGLATGTEIAVMDDKHHLLASGEVGEIVIRGATVITGYANREGMDQDSFSDGWFRTGDQGYLDNDEYLYLTGRLKEMINRGGEKISPKEIDDMMLGHPEIAQAAAFRVPHSTLGDDVAVALVLRPGSQLKESSIRKYVLDRIGEFKAPSRFFILDEIPKGATGKLNRSELSARFARHVFGQGAELKNGLEEKVAGIYREVLSVENIGSSDNFFELGGDSIRATQVINRVRALFQVNLSMAVVFRKPTVSELAAEIVKMIGNAN